MATFMAASLAVGLAVVLYVGRMGLRQRRLQQTLDTLQDRLPRETIVTEPPAKAA